MEPAHKRRATRVRREPPAEEPTRADPRDPRQTTWEPNGSGRANITRSDVYLIVLVRLRPPQARENWHCACVKKTGRASRQDATGDTPTYDRHASGARRC